MDEVTIFIRPGDNPLMSVIDSDILIKYNNQWINFRDGVISVIPYIKQLNTANPFGGIDCGG